MNRKEEYEFYAQPENQVPQGSGRRRKTAMTAMVPVRLPEETLATIRELAEQQDRSVSSWIRQAVKNEITREVLEPSRRNVHVVPDKSGGWEIFASGPPGASRHADSQAAAVECARAMSRGIGGAEVVIHGRDGRVRDSGRTRRAED